MSKTPFTFFGSSIMSIHILEALLKSGYAPSLIITTPDKRAGRKLVLTPNVVKSWAQSHSIPALDPEKLDDTFIKTLRDLDSKNKVHGEILDLFIIASYGKIIPQTVLDIPKYKSLNVHPSILPKYRGASPLQSAILDDEKSTGVSIMRIDEIMDHGPIVAQKKVSIEEWPIYEDFEKMMGNMGGELLAESIEPWVSGKITEIEQDHAVATFTRKFTKEDGLVDLKNEMPEKDAREIFLKIQAFHEWPTTYFFAEKSADSIRVKITSASYSAGKLIIEKVIPEGKSEMTFSDFLSRGYVV